MFTIASTKDKTHSERDTPTPKKKCLVVQYNKQANKAEIRSVTLENVQECLEDMGLDISEYIKFKARWRRHQHMNMLDKM